MKKLLFILLVKIITNDIILHQDSCTVNQRSHIAIVDEGPTVPFDEGIILPLMFTSIFRMINKRVPVVLNLAVNSVVAIDLFL